MTAPATTSARPAGVWEDFVDIFYAPSTVFERRRSGRFGLALLILTVLSALVFFATRPAIQPALDAQTDRAVEQLRNRPDIPADRRDAAEANARKFAGIGASVSAVLGMPILVFVTGLLLWLVGKLFESKQTLSQAIMVTTYANVPRILGALLIGLLAYFTPPEQMTSMMRIGVNAARLAPEGTSPAVLGLLSRLDPFTIWATVLLAIGLRITGGVTKRASYIAATILFVLGTLVAVSGAMKQG